MEKKKITKGFTTFIKSEVKGTCPCCDKDVHTDNLWVEEQDKTYHFSCYNELKASEKK